MEFVSLIAVILIVVLMFKKWGKTTSEEDPQPPGGSDAEPDDRPGPPPPTFKVVALGLSGSGKTVLLASMFHHLNHVTTDHSYFLDATPEQRITLDTIYRISNTDQGWPRGTRLSECTEYLFDCVAVDETNARHPVLRISYLDYAGELLETAQESGQGAFRQLTEHIGSAHALLGVLDGYRILQLLRGEETGRRHLEFEVQTMLGLLQSATAPVHVVISKWDLVRGFGEPEGADDQLRLQCVIDALMRFSHFRSLAFFRPGQVVRLIPVSAVGPTFAEIGADGAVVKRPGAQLQPKNVDVPLSAVVPDLFRQVERTLDDQARRKINDEVRRAKRGGLGKLLSGMATFFNRGPGMVLRTVLVGAVGGGQIVDEVSRMFIEWAARPYETMAGKTKAMRQVREAELIRFRAARALVLAQFETAVRRLEAIMPNSELGRP
jgi:hypothetical protein